MLTRSEIWLQSIEANAMLRGEEIGLEKGRVEGIEEGIQIGEKRS
jgi:predicted transposase YdaD